MDDYTTTINSIFSDFLSNYNNFTIAEYSSKTMQQGEKILSDIDSFINLLTNNIELLKSTRIECKKKIESITDHLSVKEKKEDFVYHTKNGMLSYSGKDVIDHMININKKKKKREIPENFLVENFGLNITLKYKSNIMNIPPMFSYYRGNSKISAGIYCCLLPGIFAKVPFPEIIDYIKDEKRNQTVRCKYKSRKVCEEQRIKISKYYQSEVRECNFIHIGEKIVKIGYPARCPSNLSFGNPKTLSSDLKTISIDDIKNLLLYGLNDVIIAIAWLQKENIKKMIFDELDVV